MGITSGCVTSDRSAPNVLFKTYSGQELIANVYLPVTDSYCPERTPEPRVRRESRPGAGEPQAMTWEAITALATLGTGAAIVATVLLGIRQLRLTRSQLEHLRQATQLQGAMAIFDDLNTAEFWDSLHFIATELPERLKDDAEFRSELALIGMADTKVHRELPLMRTFERIGTYVKHGLIDGPIIYDLALPPIEKSWELLGDVVKAHRAQHGEAFWENFEMLYREGRRWNDRTRGRTSNQADRL